MVEKLANKIKSIVESQKSMIDTFQTFLESPKTFFFFTLFDFLLRIRLKNYKLFSLQNNVFHNNEMC